MVIIVFLLIYVFIFHMKQVQYYPRATDHISASVSMSVYLNILNQ